MKNPASQNEKNGFNTKSKNVYKYIGSQAVSICFFPFLLRLDGPPLFFKFLDSAFFATGKDVGMATNHLLIDTADGVLEGEVAIFFIDLGHENHQEQHVAKLFTEVFRVIVVDGLDNLGEFFDKIFFQAEGGLFLIPGAAVRAKQGADGAQEVGEMEFCV